MGSTCYIIDTGENFIINGLGYWEIYKNGNSENNGSSGSEVTSHSELVGRNLPNQHPIRSVSNLDNRLNNIDREIGLPIYLSMISGQSANTDVELSDKTQAGRAITDSFIISESAEVEFLLANTDYSYVLLTSADGVATASSWTKSRYLQLDNPEAKYRIILRNTAMGNSEFDSIDHSGTFILKQQNGLNDRVDELEKNEEIIKELSLRLNSVEEEIALDGIAYPDEESALTEAVTAAADENTIVFGVVADTHFDEDRYGMNQPKYAETFMRICSKIGADFAVHLGDMVEEGSLTSDAFAFINDRHMGRMMEEYAKTQIPFIYTIGHHEQYPITLTTEEIDGVTIPTNTSPYPVNIIMERTFDLIKKNGSKIASSTVVKHNGSGSYYFDITKGSTVRFIVADSTSWGANGFSPAVVDFVSNALEDAAELGYMVVVFAHNAANRYAVPISSTENPADYIAAGKWNINNGEAMEEAIRNSGANVITYIHGHTHRDNIVQLREVTPGADGYSIAALGEYINAFPYVSVCCQRVVNQGSCHADYVQGEPTSYARQRNTYSEYCFDIALLHTDTGTIELYRFGAGDTGAYPTRSI